MSTTFKINGSFVTDPKTLSWQSIASTVLGSIGQPVQSKLRTAMVEFPVMTAAEYVDWFEVCDALQSGAVVAGAPSVRLPRRSDAAYTTDPETASYTTPDPLTSIAETHYILHFMGGSPGPGGHIYNARFQVYIWVDLGTP